jgi:hypothetical protein
MTTKTKSASHSRLEVVSAMIEEQGLTKKELIGYLTMSIEIRALENNIANLLSKAVLKGASHLYAGQEAVAVGAVAALLEGFIWIIAARIVTGKASQGARVASCDLTKFFANITSGFDNNLQGCEALLTVNNLAQIECASSSIDLVQHYRTHKVWTESILAYVTFSQCNYIFP